MLSVGQSDPTLRLEVVLPGNVPTRVRRARRAPWSVSFLALSVVGHVLLLATLALVSPYLIPPKPDRASRPVSLVILDPVDAPEEDEPEEEPIEEPEGQIVQIAPPEVEERPEDADYLDEYNETVEEETRARQFKVNPEVLAKQYSREEAFEMEDLIDLNVEEQSTGATVGNDRFDPDRHGTLASLPSPWELTNKEGPQDPVASSQTEANLSGAPQNDLLKEKLGDEVNVNRKEYLYAGYINRIRQLVNFYWQQNLDNLPSSVRLARPRYTTAVDVILNADGALEFIEVVADSGSTELDDCVVRAFRSAGPFPNPPEGLIQKDGRVYLPEFDWTVQLTAARNQYQGIDPRAGVQFPGILKSPR